MYAINPHSRNEPSKNFSEILSLNKGSAVVESNIKEVEQQL